MTKVRPLTADEVLFSIQIEPEDIPVRGNALASGDDAADKEAEDTIISDLEGGNEWAWCCVVVTATWRGHEGRDTLGGCSYKSEEDFKQGGYFEQMKTEALADLNREIAALDETLEPLRSAADEIRPEDLPF